MSKKQGTALVQNLSKQEVIAELKSRGIEANEQEKLDVLRRVLREDCKKQEEESEQQGIRVIKKEIKMEYTAKLDFKLGTDEWEEFVERMELYFEANEIENAEKKEPYS